MPGQLEDRTEVRMRVFEVLDDILTRPELFARMTTVAMWTDPHLSEQMLRAHLDPTTDAASRPPEAIDRHVAWLVSRFGLGPGRSVLDLGCGPGLYTSHLARTGACVVGVDVSRRSLDHARTVALDEGLAIRYLEADYLDMPDVGRHDLVALIWCDYGALSPAQRTQLLRGVSSVLEPGGHLVFDVHSRIAFAGQAETVELERDLMGGFWSPDPYIGVHTRHLWSDEFVTLDRYDIITATDHRTFCNWTTYFDETGLAAELEDGGFVVEDVLGDLAGSPRSATDHQVAVVARPRP
jgi:SAM-dependent methyltransferase